VNHGRLLDRTWGVAWSRKWMFLAGFATVVGGFGLRSPVGLVVSNPRVVLADVYSYLSPSLTSSEMQAIESNFVAAYYSFMAICIPVGLLVFAASRIAVGAVVAGSGQEVTFADALRIGWERGWRLFGVAVLFSVPDLLIRSLNVLFINRVGTPNAADPAAAAMMRQTMLSLFCLAVIVGIPLATWLILAEQAIVREGAKLFESMGRALQVFLAHPGQVIVLVLIQYGLGLTVALILAVPLVSFLSVAQQFHILFPLLCVIILVCFVFAVLANTLTYVYWSLAYVDFLAAGRVAHRSARLS
jgi:hypothetical protein